MHIGAPNLTVLPYDISAGLHTRGTVQNWDLMVAGETGLLRVQAQAGDAAYTFKDEPFVNAPIHALLSENMDAIAETERADETGIASIDDVVWYAETPCSDADSFTTNCPYALDDTPVVSRRGCFGVLFSGGANSLIDSELFDEGGGCLRHHLTLVPAGLCVGDFNGDDRKDVALSSRDSGDVLFFLGNGRGGFLDPPDQTTLLNGGTGGPLACGDIDGNGTDDVVVLSRENSTIQVLKTTP